MAIDSSQKKTDICLEDILTNLSISNRLFFNTIPEESS